MSGALVNIDRVSRSFGSTLAVDDVSLELREGEILSLLGASGSGKTTLARILVGLEQPSSGRVLYDGVELDPHAHRRDPAVRREIQLIFQDPYSSMSSRFNVEEVIAEPLRIGRCQGDHGARVRELLPQVGLPRELLPKRPGDLSGGERQRVAIARALIRRPRVIVADEIVSMLDSSRKLAIVDLLARLREQRGLAVLFISHDIALAARISDRIAVMRRGRIVETGSSEAIVERPERAYTRELLAAVPTIEGRDVHH